MISMYHLDLRYFISKLPQICPFLSLVKMLKRAKLLMVRRRGRGKAVCHGPWLFSVGGLQPL